MEFRKKRRSPGRLREHVRVRADVLGPQEKNYVAMRWITDGADLRHTEFSTSACVCERRSSDLMICEWE